MKTRETNLLFRKVEPYVCTLFADYLLMNSSDMFCTYEWVQKLLQIWEPYQKITTFPMYWLVLWGFSLYYYVVNIGSVDISSIDLHAFVNNFRELQSQG